MYSEMRKVREEFEHSKNEIAVLKKAAKAIREKVADFHKVAYQLSNSERKCAVAGEEITQLR